MDRSTAVTAAAERIRNVDRGQGLTTVYPDETTGELVVLWKNPSATVRALDGTVQNGMTVSVRSARYSQEDLLAAGERVLTASLANRVARVVSVTGTADGNALAVTVPAGVRSANTDARLIEQYTRAAGVPATIVTGEEIFPTSRQNDSDPWYGGGLIRHPGFNPPGDLNPYEFCTVSFAAIRPDGYGRLLSAAHCDSTGNIAWDDGAGDGLTLGGSTVSVKTTNDTMLIDPIGGTRGYVHGGPWDATKTHSRYHLKVGGVNRAVYGERVCTSGANSGEHCGLIVLDRTMRQFTCEGAICNGFSARASSPTVAATVGGDSGGPVYANRTDGRVDARGTIFGGDGTINCGRVRFPVGNCYATVFFVDIKVLESVWGVRVETVS